jgi:hypothetical protein
MGTGYGIAAVPKFATIFVENQQPDPPGKVEVTPGGRIIFLNQDKYDYCVRFFKPGTNPASGFGGLLPANGSYTVLIDPGDEYMYEISNAVLASVDSVRTGAGGGPIKN